jgi:hypothetical protein
MSNYRNIEINLLPPELMPPPTVRTAVILNIAIVLGVLAYMGIATFAILGKIKSEQEAIEDAEKQIKAKQPIVEMYTQLDDVHEKVNKYGRLVSLASVEYIDAPVLLDRLSKIIPAGVYLSRVSNEKASANAKTSVIQVEMVTTKDDPGLMQQTLDAFKKDSMFHDCYMRAAEVRKESIGDQLPGYGVDWTATGPKLQDVLNVDKYQFVVLANVPKLVDTSNLPVTSDHSIYLADVPFKTPPPEEDTKGKPKGNAHARTTGTQKPEMSSQNAPEGVKPVGVN